MSIQDEDKKSIFSYFDKMSETDIRKLVTEYLKTKHIKRPYNDKNLVKQTIQKYKYRNKLRPKEIIQNTADELYITFGAVEKVYYSIYRKK